MQSLLCLLAAACAPCADRQMEKGQPVAAPWGPCQGKSHCSEHAHLRAHLPQPKSMADTCPADKSFVSAPALPPPQLRAQLSQFDALRGFLLIVMSCHALSSFCSLHARAPCELCCHNAGACVWSNARFWLLCLGRSRAGPERGHRLLTAAAMAGARMSEEMAAPQQSATMIDKA